MPAEAQQFISRDKTWWTVDAVTRDSLLEGFYLVRLRHGKRRECDEGAVVLAPREYKALLRTRGLVRVREEHPTAA